MKPKQTKVCKASKRGITFSDAALFPIKTRYKYVIAQKSKKVFIVPSADGTGNTVSRKKRKNQVLPLIDIRNQKAVSQFAEDEFLQVLIYDDQIVVESYEAKASSFGHACKKVKSLLAGKKKKTAVTDITDFLEVKKKRTVVFSRKDLSLAAGEQTSFDLFDWDVNGAAEETSSFSQSFIGNALKHLPIPLQVSSLFSGAGLFDKGFVDAGFEVLFALEKDEHAAMTYRHNLGDHIQVADITAFDKNLIAKAPVMIGGSPCQGFSQSNRYTHFLDNPNNLLVKQYIEAVKANQNCQVFVLENVPQILTAGDGQFKEEIYDALSEFDITSGVLRAEEYGSPQKRKRAIFIGSKIGKIELPKPTHREGFFKTVGQALKGLTQFVANQLDFSKGKLETVERMKHVPQGGNWKSIPEHLQTKAMREGKAHSSIYHRLHPDEPSITIPNPRKTNITHPYEDRMISIREAARLFDLPDSYEFLGPISSKQQQIGNAVTVCMAKAIALEIIKAISRVNIRNRTETFRLV